MIYTDSLPDEALADIAEQIGNRLPSILDAEALAGVDIELADTFQVWMVGAESLTAARRHKPDLNTLAERTDGWHHQITFNGEAKVIARSYCDEHLQTCQLAELFESPLAQKIQHAATSIQLSVIPERQRVIRLLVAPAYQTHALWLYDEAENASQVMVIDWPEDIEVFGFNRLVNAGKFLSVLSRAPHMSGYTHTAR